MKNCIQTLFLFLILTQLCSAQWFWQNPLPQGNSLNAVQMVTEDIGYAVGEFGLVLKTTDGGASWFNSPTPNNTNIEFYALHFLNVDTGVVAGTEEINNYLQGISYITLNGGTSWSVGLDYTQFDFRSVWLIDADNFLVSGINPYIGYGLVIRKSLEDTCISPLLSKTLYSVCLINNNTGYVVGEAYDMVQGTIFRTTDGGYNWPDQRFAPKILKSITFANENIGTIVGDNIIYQSTDGGITWFVQQNYSQYFFRSVSCSGPDNMVAVGGEGNPNGNLYANVGLVTTDGGTNWNYIPYLKPYKLILNSVSLLNYAGAMVGETGIIYYTTDIGATWNAASSFVTYDDLNSVFYLNSEVGYAVGLEGTILYTNNGGTTWVEGVTVSSSYYLEDVFFTDINNGTVVGWWTTGGNPQGLIMRTTNGGVDWSVEYIYGVPKLHSVFFTDANNGYAVSESNAGVILRTTNGGINWIQRSGGTSNAMYDIYFTDANNGTVVCEAGTILRTTDGGDNWSQQTSGTNKSLHGVFFTSENNGVAVGDSTILRTTNGGINWELQAGEYRLRSVHFSDVNYGVAVSEGGKMLKTTDGGMTWNFEISLTNRNLNGVWLQDLNRATVVGDGGTILRNTNLTSVDEEQINEMPTEFLLWQNYPNPFNPSTKIKYSIPTSHLSPSPYQGEGNRERSVTLKVYDILGREVAILVNEDKPTGTYEVTWYAENLPSGVYFYQLRVGNPSTSSGQGFVETKKMILLK